MDIIQRNFLRLLRRGAFDRQETLEPMSDWKWERLYQMAQQHGVTPWVADGISKCKDDFFLQLSPALRQKFADNTTDRTEMFKEQHLSNPLLERKLQEWGKQSETAAPTYELLLHIIGIARHTIVKGISLRQLIAFGTYLQQTQASVDYEQLTTWIEKLSMKRMAWLEGALLVELFHFPTGDIRFAAITDDSRQLSRVVKPAFSRKTSARLMARFPSEAASYYASNIIRIIKSIEE